MPILQRVTRRQPTAAQEGSLPGTHGCPAGAQHDREVPEIDLLSPLTIRGITLRNRIVVSPMCQYSSDDGLANDWHLVHLGSRAAGGVGLVVVEATAVTPEGRITPKDMGIWGDQHIEPLARIARFVHSQGAIAGIQLAHAGRKASCDVPWLGGARLKTPESGGWTVVGPSAVPFREGDPPPVALDEAGSERHRVGVREGRRSRAGRRFPAHRGARGPWLPAARIPLAPQQPPHRPVRRHPRKPHAISAAGVRARRALVPAGLPVFVRISATDWVEGGWDIEHSVVFARQLRGLGIDLIDCSSGALTPTARIPVGKGFQVPFARRDP